MTRSDTLRVRPGRLLAAGAAILAIAALVAGCSSGGSATSAPSAAGATGGDITGTWQLVAITTKRPDSQGVVPQADQDRYVITFADDGTAEIQADCNRIRGQYETTTGGGLTITLGPSTLVACPEGSLGSDFADSLAKAATYGVDGDTLVITDSEDGTLELTAAA